MSPEPGMSMLIDRVDDSDHVIGTISREQVFRAHANFRVVHVFLFDGEGRLLIQQLSLTRERNPGRWGSSVAAYLFAGEVYEEAARRRLWEELRIRDIELAVAGKTVMNDNGCRKYISLFTGTCVETLHPDPAHIASVQPVSLANVARMVTQQPEILTPTFIHVFKYFQSEQTH